MISSFSESSDDEVEEERGPASSQDPNPEPTWMEDFSYNLGQM